MIIHLAKKKINHQMIKNKMFLELLIKPLRMQLFFLKD
jgi:hypothetical protein